MPASSPDSSKQNTEPNKPVRQLSSHFARQQIDSPWRRARRRFCRDRLAMVGLIILAMMVLLSNLLADILYAVADPRIHYD